MLWKGQTAGQLASSELYRKYGNLSDMILSIVTASIFLAGAARAGQPVSKAMVLSNYLPLIYTKRCWYMIHTESL